MKTQPTHSSVPNFTNWKLLTYSRLTVKALKSNKFSEKRAVAFYFCILDEPWTKLDPRLNDQLWVEKWQIKRFTKIAKNKISKNKMVTLDSNLSVKTVRGLNLTQSLNSDSLWLCLYFIFQIFLSSLFSQKVNPVFFCPLAANQITD